MPGWAYLFGRVELHGGPRYGGQVKDTPAGIIEELLIAAKESADDLGLPAELFGGDTLEGEAAALLAEWKAALEAIRGGVPDAQEVARRALDPLRHVMRG